MTDGERCPRCLSRSWWIVGRHGGRVQYACAQCSFEHSRVTRDKQHASALRAEADRREQAKERGRRAAVLEDRTIRALYEAGA